MTKKVQSTIKPEPVEIDEYSVWLSTNIQEVTMTDEEGQEYTEYEYDLTQVSKDEYILQLHDDQRQVKLENDLAIADLAETLFGGGF